MAPVFFHDLYAGNFNEHLGNQMCSVNVFFWLVGVFGESFLKVICQFGITLRRLRGICNRFACFLGLSTVDVMPLLCGWWRGWIVRHLRQNCLLHSFLKVVVGGHKVAVAVVLVARVTVRVFSGTLFFQMSVCILQSIDVACICSIFCFAWQMPNEPTQSVCLSTDTWMGPHYTGTDSWLRVFKTSVFIGVTFDFSGSCPLHPPLKPVPGHVQTWPFMLFHSYLPPPKKMPNRLPSYSNEILKNDLLTFLEAKIDGWECHQNKVMSSHNLTHLTLKMRNLEVPPSWPQMLLTFLNYSIKHQS